MKKLILIVILVLILTLLLFLFLIDDGYLKFVERTEAFEMSRRRNTVSDCYNLHQDRYK